MAIDQLPTNSLTRGLVVRPMFDMQVTLWKWNLDGGLAKFFVDREVQFTGYIEPSWDTQDADPQLKLQRAVAKCHEQGFWTGCTPIADNLRMLMPNFFENLFDFVDI